MTIELVAFVVCCALSAVWLILVVDIFAVKTPSKGLKAVCITFGSVGIVLAALAAFVTAGLLLGFAAIEGDSLSVFGFAVPTVAPYAALFTRPVMWGFAALIAVLSLLLVIGGAVKPVKQKPVLYAPEVESAPLEESTAAAEDSAAEEEESYEMDEVRDMMDEISGLVDRLDSIAESLKESEEQAEDEPLKEDQDEQSEEQIEEQADEHEELEEQLQEESAQEEESDVFGLYDEEESEPEVEEESFGEPTDEPYEDGEEEYGPLTEDESEEETEEPYEDEPEEETEEPYEDEPEVAAEEEEIAESPKVEQEDVKVAAANRSEPLRTLTRSVRSEPRKFTPINIEEDGYPTPASRTLVRTKDGVKKVGAEPVKETEQKPLPAKEESAPVKRGAETEKPRRAASETRPKAKKPEPMPEPTTAPKTPVKEVEPIIGGLPITKRHVIMNRRNVVNMFSEYLKSKSEDEKKRLENSINTIIIK